jgi:periplasmic divalent cation tolerance protein
VDTSDFIVVLVTSPSAEEGEKLASTLIDERLAACVNVIPVTSFFRWEGKACKESERLLVIKTRGSLFENLEKRVRELHSYDVPEIIALPMIAGSRGYLDWIEESVSEG